MARSPATSTTQMPANPARTESKASTNTENSHGARNDTARPVMA